MRNGGVFKGLHLQNKVVKRIDEECCATAEAKVEKQ
jgi:hypothetical protein